MPDKADKYKEYMESLSDSSLVMIIEKDFADYEINALEAAKLELDRRKAKGEFVYENYDILNTDKSGLIKLADILTKVECDKVLENISNINPKAVVNIVDYRQVLNHLKLLEPVTDSSVQINISRNPEGNFDIIGTDQNTMESFGVEFFPWNEWFAFGISKEAVLKFDKENIAALVLLKMTANGFTEDKIQHRLDEMQTSSDSICIDDRAQNEPVFLYRNTLNDDAIARGIEQLKKGIVIDGEVPQIRPWVRCWARSVDSTLWSALIYMIWHTIHPASYIYINSIFIYISIFPFFWAFAEAILLSTWGTTPGKRLLQVFVTDESGRKLSFKSSLYRSLFVWSCGNGCEIRYLGMITNIISYFQLTNKGKTWWDSKGKFKVSHKRIGICRALIAAAIILLLTVCVLLQIIKIDFAA